MVRLVVYLLLITLLAVGLGWLADRPGTLEIAWQGYVIETSVFRAVVILTAVIGLAVFLWSLARTLWHSPALIGQRIVRRREKRGLDALSGGLIAIGSGDSTLASRYALLARKSLPHEPLTQLLRAQAAQLSGDRATARRIYEAMLASPETEQLGLRGLFLEAQREGASEAALQFASRALAANPQLGWSAEALFDLQCKHREWANALETLAQLKKGRQIDKPSFERKRAVLLAVQALEAEDNEADKALALALEAHNLAPDLVPAAAVAGRILAARGQTAKAAKIIQKTWSRSPHPELAAAYAYARVGDSTQDRLSRVKHLAALNPMSIESPIAIATTAIEARLFDEARAALEPLLNGRLTQRVAALMARVEAGDGGTHGRVREWLARAVTAAPDPAWIADGVIADNWDAVSPIDGKLDAYQWRVPTDTRDEARATITAERLEELLSLEAPRPMADVAGGAGIDRSGDIVDAETVTMTVTAKRDAGSSVHPAAATAAKATNGGQDSNSAEAVSATVSVAPMRDIGSDRAAASKDTKIFVAPHAPDDPGPDVDAEADSVYPRRAAGAGN